MDLEFKEIGIVRYFDDPTLYYPKQILMSSYLLRDGLFEALKTLKTLRELPDRNMYVVNVIYHADPKVKDLTGDMQLFMTGTVDEDESFVKAVTGEIREEIRMELNECDLKEVQEVTHNVKWFACDVKNLVPTNNITKRNTDANNINSGKKVVCILYGSLDEMKEFLERIPVQSEENGEYVKGLACIKLEDIYNLIPIIYKNYKRPIANYKKFYWTGGTTHRLAFEGRFFPENCVGTI